MLNPPQNTYTQGTLICGGVGVVIAVFLPFTILEDMISAGVLVAFNMTNTGLMLHRRQHATRPALPRWLALGFNTLALAAAFLWCVSSVRSLAQHRSSERRPRRETHRPDTKKLRVKLPRGDRGGGWLALQLLTTAAAVVPLAVMERLCPDAAKGTPRTTFRTPLVPWIPGLGAFFNWFLLAQLTWQGLGMVAAYILASLALYFAYGYRHSVGATSGCVFRCVRCLPSFHFGMFVYLTFPPTHPPTHPHPSTHMQVARGPLGFAAAALEARLLPWQRGADRGAAGRGASQRAGGGGGGGGGCPGRYAIGRGGGGRGRGGGEASGWCGGDVGRMTGLGRHACK